MLIKLTVKYFDLLLQALFSLQPVRCFKQEFYIFDSPFYHRTNYFLFFRLRDIKYFSCVITLFLRCKKPNPRHFVRALLNLQPSSNL